MSCYRYEITAQDLFEGLQLADGDIITLTRAAGTSDNITVSLQETCDNSWKAVLLFDNEGNYTTVAEVFNSGETSTGTIQGFSIIGKYFVLSKAGSLGIHMNIYNVTDAAFIFNPGDALTFVWSQD